jgi:hypothetical protein
MPSPIILKIDVKKLKKEWFFKANSGAVYADLVLYENDQPDEYGNSHAIKQNPPKAARDAGEKGHYVGNGKFMPSRDGGASSGRGGQSQARPASGQRQQGRPQQTQQREEPDYGSMSDDDVPFARPHYLMVGGV